MSLVVFPFTEKWGADPAQLVLGRPGETIVLEPYAPTIIRVSLSTDHSEAMAKPGYGITGNTSSSGWTQERSEGADTYTSSRLRVQVFGRGIPSASQSPLPSRLQTQADIARFFNGSAPGAHIVISTPEGKTLSDMTGWAMAVPNYKDGNAEILMDPARWPDPVAMNKTLHDLGIQTMISVWPRFAPGSRYYEVVRRNNWFLHLADGTPTNGLPYDRAGSDIDTTNPEAARWFWDRTRQNYIEKGFDAIWADETEPDLPPNGSYFSIGPGTRYFNVYPLFHTAALYDGFRRDVKHRAVILSRDGYLGAQHNGTIFWSSDISPTWDTFARQVPTGLNFAATGFANWSNDIGGWQYLPGGACPVDRRFGCSR